MYVDKTVTMRRAKCKEPGCHFEVSFNEAIPDGETQAAECPNRHRFEYRADDVRSWSNNVRIGRH
jgi:hypothetical protein